MAHSHGWQLVQLGGLCWCCPLEQLHSFHVAWASCGTAAVVYLVVSQETRRSRGSCNPSDLASEIPEHCFRYILMSREALWPARPREQLWRGIRTLFLVGECKVSLQKSTWDGRCCWCCLWKVQGCHRGGRRKKVNPRKHECTLCPRERHYGEGGLGIHVTLVLRPGGNPVSWGQSPGGTRV